MADRLKSRLRAGTVSTPLGEMTVVAGEVGIVATYFGKVQIVAEPAGRELRAATREIESYFAGKLRAFSAGVDLSFAGTDFSRRVIEATMAVPFNDLRTYGDIADEAGSPKAGRAAGSVLARCPIEIFVPCHRVVSSGRSLGGYGGHEERKAFLVGLEARLAR